MTSLKVQVANTTDIANGLSATIIGKNGFSGTAGSVPLLVTVTPEEVDVTAGSSNVKLTLDHLGDVLDKNFNKQILEVNDGSFLGLKGFDSVAIPINEKTASSIEPGFVGHDPLVVQYSANIVNVDLSTDSVKFNNESVGGTALKSIIPDPPFYARVSQILDPRFFANNFVFLEGTFKDFTKSFNVSGVTGIQSFDIGVSPRKKEFIDVFVDGIQLTQSSFNHTIGDSNVVITLTGNEIQIRTKVSHYTVPAVEIGDNVFISSGNIYAISETSYSNVSGNPSFNAALTANCIYGVKFEQDLRANVTALSLINISVNPRGSVGNLDTNANTFTVDYNENIFPGNFDLANNRIYRVQVPLNFNPITLEKNRVIRGVNSGINVVRARTINPMGRKSRFVTKVIDVQNSSIRKVKNLSIDEFLLLDTTQGVTVNIEVSFDHILNQDVVDYELSYKLSGEAADTTNFTTVKLSALGADSSGKIRYIINNVDRGRAAAVNQITVKVTAISSVDLRGITATEIVDIEGKRAPPQNITKLLGGQQGTNIIFIYEIPKNADGSLIDLDLLDIEIRRASGTVAEADFSTAWVTATDAEFAPVPTSSFTLPVTRFGTNTYLFRTRDTSKNVSASTVGITLTTVKPANITILKTWSESDPTGNVVTGLPNDNLNETNYPSRANSNNGGLSNDNPPTSFVDNANGTSSGWSTTGDVTDLFASANAVYQTQVRDVGFPVEGVLSSFITGTQPIRTTFNEFRTNVLEIVSNAESSTETVLVSNTSGGIGAFLTNATFNTTVKTLTSGGISGNVFAIWNSGQFSGDLSNANSYAFIAGVINTNAVALGNTFFANGNPTGGNVLQNLTSNALSLQLVDLFQFSDDIAETTFIGKDSVTSINSEVRYSLTTPFYANSNVDTSVFVASGTDSDGWRPASVSEINFRFFQHRYTLTNTDPALADFTLDVLDYVINLASRSFTKFVEVTSNTTAVNYSGVGYVNIPGNPIITGTAIGSNALSVVVSDFSNDEANIQVFNTNTGLVVTGVNVFFEATGV